MTTARGAFEANYDPIAQQYAEQFFDELDRKPFDRALLERFAQALRGKGPVCDIGCGPGQIARFLHERGVEARGLDLSAEMVAHARRLNPSISFTQGDMRSIDVPDESWAGISAFYSLIHLRREKVVETLREWRRLLQPGGQVLVAFHGGSGEIHTGEMYGEQVSIDATFFEPHEMEDSFRSAGFEVVEVVERPPYPFEYQSRRIYLWARRPD